MAMHYDDLRKRLQIDKRDLDTEIAQNPEMFADAGDMTTDANSERDTAKEALDQMDAELYFKCKEDLEEEGGKPTETAIKMAVEMHMDHIKATDRYLDAKRKAEKLGVLKESFQMRSYALKDMAGLYVANYFTTDSVRRGPADEYRSKAVMDRHREGRRERRTRLRDDDD